MSRLWSYETIGKNKALATTLSDTEPETNLEDIDQEEKFMAFTATIELPKESGESVSDDGELTDSKFEKFDENDDIQTTYSKLYKNFEKHEKLYRLAMKKLSEMELEREERSTKADEANQTIGALRFENNFLAEKTKKQDAELFQVRAQLEQTSSAKLDEMLNIQKAAFDKFGLGYVPSFSTYGTFSMSHSVSFVLPSKTDNSKNNNPKIELGSEV